MYGNPNWRYIKQARDDDVITGRTLKAERRCAQAPTRTPSER
jgi:hypothetical protein